MFGFIKKEFIGILNSIVNASNQTKCVCLVNQQCMDQRTLINLHPIVKDYVTIHLRLI